MADTQDYAFYSEAYLWEWADDGEVLALRNGHTIAYSAFVEETMGLLAPEGLPAFGVLLLALYATNGAANAPLDAVFALVDAHLHASHSYRKPLTDARRFLELLQQLPPEWRTGRNRFQVFRAIFENAHNKWSPVRARAACARFARLRRNPELRVPRPGFPREVYYNDFRTLELLLRRFPDQDTIIQAALALPDVDAPVLESVPPPQKAPEQRDYLEELLERPVSFPVAALVRRLWSGLHIPHHQAHPSRQPLGGVSDLANKGSFDRLLLTEFANDDTVFASRLANNEALFLNREIPPERDNRERVLLIDVSIRNWGTPRTIAFALLLAIARHPRTDIPCRAFLLGRGYLPLRFGTPLELVDALHYLDPVAHAGEGLQAFLESKEAGPDSELLYISASELASVPAVQRAIGEHLRRFQYWLYTDDQGGIDLYARQGTTRRLLQRLKLPLEELWKKAPGEEPLKPQPVPVPVQVEEGLKKKSYPLLVPAADNYRYLLQADPHTALLITRENEVLVTRQDPLNDFSKNGVQGPWELMATDAPVFQGPLAAGRSAQGDLLLAHYDARARRLVLYNVHEGSSRSFVFAKTEFTFRTIGAIKAYGERFYLRNSQWRTLSASWDQPVMVRTDAALPEALRGSVYGSPPAPPSLRTHSFLRRLRSVHISPEGDLCVNGYACSWQSEGNGGVCFWSGIKRAEGIAGQGRSWNEKRFAEGSTVRLERQGLLVLTSSDPALPVIYLHSILDFPIAMRAGNAAAGNARFIPIGVGSIPILEFYETYMKPFVQKIMNHGTAPGTR